MVERGEKNTYSDGLPKAIRIIDNKKLFKKKKKKKKKNIDRALARALSL